MSEQQNGEYQSLHKFVCIKLVPLLENAQKLNSEAP